MKPTLFRNAKIDLARVTGSVPRLTFSHDAGSLWPAPVSDEDQEHLSASKLDRLADELRVLGIVF